MQSFSLFPRYNSSLEKKEGLRIVQCVTCPDRVKTLFRGFSDANPIMFQLSTIILGIFGRTIPRSLNIDNIHQHKVVNVPSKFYFVGLSEKEAVASRKGDGNYIEVDPTLFRNFIVDVDATHNMHGMTYPQQMANELEQVCVAVPYFTIKSIHINNTNIANPFYLPIESEDKSAITEFTTLYENYIYLLRKQYENGFSTSVLTDCKDLINDMINFYEKYTFINFLDYSFGKLEELFPDFMNYFMQENKGVKNNRTTLFPSANTIKTAMINLGSNVLTQHVYTCDREKIAKIRNAVVENYYEDVYARPQYD